MEESKRPFLQRFDQNDNTFGDTSEPLHSEYRTSTSLGSRQRPGGRLFLASYIVGLLLLALVAALELVRFYHQYPNHTYSGVYWTPAKDVVQYVTHGEYGADHQRNSPYWGSATDEQYESWLRLVEPTFFRVSQDEMKLAGENIETSVELYEGGGYLASFGVYHELHCLRRIRLWINREKYYPHITPDLHDGEMKHLDHCVESLRLSAMCRPNLAMYAYEWGTNNTSKPMTKSAAKQKCVNWEALDDWAREKGVGFSPELKGPSKGI